MRKKIFCTGPTIEQPRQNKNLLYMTSPKKPAKKESLSFVLFEFLFTSVSTAGKNSNKQQAAKTWQLILNVSQCDNSENTHPEFPLFYASLHGAILCQSYIIDPPSSSFPFLAWNTIPPISSCTVKKTKIQGASVIDARFLKLSHASAISPIITKFSQYTPHSTCYLVLVFICWQETGESESSHCQKNPRRMREDGEQKI